MGYSFGKNLDKNGVRICTMIPRILFQTFKTKELTPAFQKVVDSWKVINPGYEYRFYDDQMCDLFMKEFDSRVWKAYKRIIPGAFKADLWRYCVLYTYGGVYADLDTICIGKIDDFLNDTTEFVGVIDIKQSTLMFNAFIAAEPGSKILKGCIDQMVYYIEHNTIPEDRGHFACGTLATEMKKFMRLSDLTGQHGWHGNVHLLHFEEETQNVHDNHRNILFQNRYGNLEFNEMYISELNKVNVSQWWFVKDTMLKEDPLTIYQWEDKIRLGAFADGGYVIADNVGTYDLYISAGVSNEESFSRDFIKKYSMDESNSFAFDGTITNYPYDYTSDISFTCKNISTVNDPKHTNLDNLLSRHENAFLKMDIEGHEWNWLAYSPYLKNIKQMVIEFHGPWADPWCWGWAKHNLSKEFINDCFEKISETHFMIHAHGNNGAECIDGRPNVIELTYLRRDKHALDRNTTGFPIKNLDFPNGGHCPDYVMNAQPFLRHTKKVAIYNGFKFHYETIGHVIEYCKSRQYELVVYSETDYSWGWFEYYGIEPKDPKEYTHNGFDRVFLLTDDDWSFPVTPDEKIICIEHTDFQRRSGNVKRVTYKQRKDVPCITFSWSIPRVPKTLRICVLGGAKEKTCKYPVEVVCIGRENPVDATEMMRVMTSCQYMLFLNFPNFRGTSGTISMSYTCGCRLITTKNFIDEYGLKSAIDYDATDELVSMDPSDVYEEAERLIEQRNKVYDSFFLTQG
jgi:hypothetical protein